MEKNKEWAKEIFKKIEIKLLRTADASFDKIPYTTVSGVHDDKNAYITNMNEERQNELDITKSVSIAKQKIITIELEY